MADVAKGVVIEVDSQHAGEAFRAFLTWAGSTDSVRVLFTPDVSMAVETPGHRGFILDEIYWVTIYVEHGAPELVELLGELPHQTRPPTSEPDPAGLISAILQGGEPFQAVKHLI